MLGILYVVAIAAMHGSGLTDEVEHFAQIHLFLRGDWRLIESLTTIPGYHIVSAALLWMFGADSLAAARLVNAAFGLFAIAGFHALRRQVWPKTETLATAQFAALPIVVPFFFVVYTDVLALALLLWATFATLKGRHWFSAVLLAALVCVRQNEVVWAGFLAILAVWPIWRRCRLQAWGEMVASGAPYLGPVAGFIAFWIWNGSISLSSTQAALHPDLTLHAGNVYFALVLAGVLLPFHVFVGLREFAARARAQPWLFAIALLVIAAFWWSFHADNPYNTAFPDYYLHNAFVRIAAQYPVVRAGLATLAAAAVCGLAYTRLRPQGSVWVYPFAALFLAASWLVESRYALVPFVLWLAFREQRTRRIEYATLALWLVLAVFVFSGMVERWFFP
ncbi:MAG: hypothetical protein ABI082_07285 [Dokdonella sp.]